MKLCSHCQKQIEDSAKFCPYCGESQSRPVCGTCGKELQSDWKICPECGTRVTHMAAGLDDLFALSGMAVAENQAEKERLEAERKAEEERLAAEKRRQEELRLRQEAEQKRQEERRRLQEEAERQQNDPEWLYQEGLKHKAANPKSARASEYFKKAADKGHIPAAYEFGICCACAPYDRASHDAAALKYFRMAANAGYAPAEDYLGSYYFNGRGVPQNTAEAMKLFLSAAGRGYEPAYYRLALIYLDGQNGIPKNRDEAEKWRRKVTSPDLLSSLELNFNRL